MKQQEPFIWDFCNMSLQLHSRMAIACIEEGTLSRLVESYRGPVASDSPRQIEDREVASTLANFIQ